MNLLGRRCTAYDGDMQKGCQLATCRVAPYCPHAPTSITSPTRELVTWMEPGAFFCKPCLQGRFNEAPIRLPLKVLVVGGMEIRAGGVPWG